MNVTEATMSDPFSRQRRHPRVPVTLPVRISTIDPEIDPRSGRPCYRASREVCVNLSRGGLFIHTAETIAPGRRILIEMHFPDGSPLEAVGRVAWSKRVLGARDEAPRDGIGVEFIGAPPQQLEALDDFLANEYTAPEFPNVPAFESAPRAAR
jgi:Tfp pilus assembly protein PilZ